MAIDLQNESGDYLSFTNVGWSFVLCLAEQYGWQPAGTRLPSEPGDPETWEGGYISSDGQWVIEPDARSLADAIESAIADPKLPEIAGNLEVAYRQSVEEQCGHDAAANLSVGLGEYTAAIKTLRGLAGFCRAGAFQIE